MNIVWTITIPSSFDGVSISLMANKIWMSSQYGLPPDKIVINKIGKGQALYDFLSQYKLPLELGE